MKTKQIIRCAGIFAFLVMTIACSEEVVLVFDASLKITVLNVDNNPVEGAKISFAIVLEGEVLTEYPREEYSDSNGEYLLSIHDENLETRYHSENPVVLSDQEKYIQSDHEYRITTSKTDYQDVEEIITLKNGDAKQLTVKLLKK